MTVPIIILVLPLIAVWTAGYTYVGAVVLDAGTDAMLLERDVTPRRFIRVVALAILAGCLWPIAIFVLTRPFDGLNP